MRMGAMLICTRLVHRGFAQLIAPSPPVSLPLRNEKHYKVQALSELRMCSTVDGLGY
jgi:hypothetical protein